MKIVVLLKQTFDTEEKIAIVNGKIEEEEAKLIINPYDEYALEEALRLKEVHGGEVVAITCGTERTHEALRTALALGADQAVRVSSDGIPDDGSAVAAALAAAISPLQPDLVLAGLFAVDTGSGSVALQTAERLGLPHAGAVVKLVVGSSAELGLEQNDGKAYALAVRDVEGDQETVAVPLPALVTAQQGLNEPRYPSLPGIMKAKRKPLIVIEPAELKAYSPLGEASISLAAIDKAKECVIPEARASRRSLFPPPSRGAGKTLAGTPAEQAKALADLLGDSLRQL